MSKYVLNKTVIKDWRRREGRNWEWLSRQLGVKTKTFTQQVNGRGGVSLAVAIRLEEATGIPVRLLVEAVNE